MNLTENWDKRSQGRRLPAWELDLGSAWGERNLPTVTVGVS